MKSVWVVVAFASTLSVCGAAGAPHSPDPSSDYLPDTAAQKTVSISASGTVSAEIVVLTEGIAIRETGPKEAVKTFGETYQFAPSYFAVRRDEPTRIEFWNLQPDDEHDVMLFDPDWNTLLKQTPSPSEETLLDFRFSQGRAVPLLLHGPPSRDGGPDPRSSAAKAVSEPSAGFGRPASIIQPRSEVA